MKSNSNINLETSKTPSQDAQGRWYELLSPTQVLTGQNLATTATVAAATTTTTLALNSKKKKSRNRKLQRYSRKLRKQGVDKATIEMYKRSNGLRQKHQAQDMETEEIIPLNDTEDQTTQGPDNREQQVKKRKRDDSKKQNEEQQDSNCISKSLSQLSMKENTNKKKKRSSSSSKIHEQQQQEPEENEINAIQCNDNKERKSLHYYLNANNNNLKKMLKTAIVGRKDILQWCKLEENIDYVREHTRLIDRVCYLKLEEDLWKSYKSYGEAFHCWTSPLPQAVIKDNKLEFDYKISKKSMEKYIEKIKEKILKAEEQVQEHALLLKNYPPSTSNQDEQRLWAAILALVRKGQQKLSQHYEHRKKRLKNVAKDYSFIKACYDCQPTQDEIISMQIIWQATNNEGKSQENVDILKQHLFLKRIPKSLNYLDESFSKVEHMLRRPIFDDNIRTTLSTRHKKIIAQNKCDLLKLYISMAEASVRGFHEYAEKEKKNLISRMQKNPHRHMVIEQLNSAIEQRQDHIRQCMEYLTQHRLRFFYHRSDDRRQKWYRRSYHLNLHFDILPSSPIIEVYTKLTVEQLALLARGPKYVPPCQSRFYKKEKRMKLIDQEHKNIMNTITEFFRKYNYCISDKRVKEFSFNLKNLIQHLYTKKLSRKLSVRAKREHKLIMTIRRYLRNYRQVILRRTDKSKVFHLGNAKEYQRKVIEYMQETQAYEEITSNVSPLAANLQQVISLLDHLHRAEKPLITKKQYDKMRPKVSDTELGHLYFLPKPHKIGTPLRPIVAAIHAPTILVSKFLDDLLRPIFNRVAHHTIYIDSIDLVKRLENYEKQGHRLSTTKFITADVKNLYTMIPKGGALDALYRFIIKYGKDRQIGNLTVNTIIRLACVVLDTNCFVYGDKYYKQVRGGAMGSPFTMTLANIYMYEWEQTLIQYQQQRNELYGRYIDDIFMTSNESLDNIKTLLDRENAKDPNIIISYNINESVEFLDVLVENIQGQLKTSVFRKPAAEPYILPYMSDHPRYIHCNTIHTALLRGIRVCSDIETFDQERLNIEIALLLNGYPPKFIKQNFKKFFTTYNASSILQDLNSETYKTLHHRLLNESTADVKQQQQQEQQHEEDNNHQNLERKLPKPKKIIIHYQYESGPLKLFNIQFRKLWKKHFFYEMSPLTKVRLIIGTRTNKTLEHLLVDKKPNRRLLKYVDNSTTSAAMET
ncbi:unnamed protein product [Rotaria sp. Silwood2]